MYKMNSIFGACALALTLWLLASSSSAQIFSAGGRYATGTAYTMETGDFDHDLAIDIVLSDRYEDSLYIHLNDGSGGFSNTYSYEMACYEALAVGDLNADGYDDLVVNGEGYLNEEWVWGTLVYMNNGDMTFELTYADTIGSTYGYAIADFNNDNAPDIAVYYWVYMPEYGDEGLYLFYGNGDGTFVDPFMVDSTATGRPLAGDVDNDGDVDLIAGGYCLLNDGAGNFAEPFSAETSGSGGRLCHLNNDGYLDILKRETYGCSGYPACLYGHGDGTFGAPREAWRTAGLLSGIGLAAADFTCDGFTDIALYAPDNPEIIVGLNDGRQNYSRFHDTVPVISGGLRIIAADFDSDGDADLAVVGSDDTLEVVYSLGSAHDWTKVVPEDYPTVQEAVDAAWNLDTILVCPGIYYGSIDFGGKNLVLMSSDCSGAAALSTPADGLRRASATILDGGGTGRVLTFDDFEDDRSVVSGFTLQNGYGEGYGGAVYCYDTASPTIVNNIIRDNYSTSAAGAVFIHTGHATLSHNLIVNNSSGFIGGAIYVSSSTAQIMNNTVYGNSTDQGGGGLYLGYGAPTLCNNIFWNNSSNIKGQEIECGEAELPMTYSIVQGGWTGTGNLDTDPMFVDPENYDFNFLPGSPCIDAGDPAMPLDPDGSVCDIGAYFYPDPTDVTDNDAAVVPSQFALHQNYPNPFNPATRIEYSLPGRDHITIAIYNILGQEVRTLLDREQSAGRYSITWDGNDDFGRPVATGVYLYRFLAGEYSETKKMLLLK